MIKRIELKNFMSHPHTVIDLADGLTVLVGPNNCGKSAVVAALQILCHNDKSSYVLRHDEKECSVTVETDRGDVITWSRGRNRSPRYTLNGEVFDRLKQQVPRQVQEALRISKVQCESERFDVHIGEQKKPVFLLNDSPRAAAEFFASSSDTIRLVEMQARHQQNVRNQKSDRKRLRAETAELKTALEVLSPLDGVLKEIERAEAGYQQLAQRDQQAIGLAELVFRLEQSTTEQTRLTRQMTLLKKLPRVPDFQPAALLRTAVSDLCGQLQRLRRLKRRRKLLRELESPPRFEPIAPLRGAIRDLEQVATKLRRLNLRQSALAALTPPPPIQDTAALAEVISTLESQHRQARRLDKRLKQNRVHETAAREELKTIAAQNPTCPTCGNAVTVTGLLKRIEQGDAND